MGAKARFTQADVARAMKAAREAGYAQVRVIIAQDGTITIEAGEWPQAPQRANPLDRLLVNR